MNFDQDVATIILNVKLETETLPNRDVLPLELAIVPDEMWAQ